MGSKKGNKTDALTGDPTSAWREWKAREVAAEEPMYVDPEDDGINQDKMKRKSKKASTKKGSIIAMDNSDAVDGSGEKGIGISSNMKGKGKVSIREEVGKEVGMMFVVPNLPTGKSVTWLTSQPKCSHQNEIPK